MTEKNGFLDQSYKSLSELYDFINQLPKISLSAFVPDKTVLVIVDMVNGFVKKGDMSSERVYGINERIARFSQQCTQAGIAKIAFADCHTPESPEFASYPVHCLSTSEESEITEEIAKTGGYTLIKKNSTNGFLEPSFQQKLQQIPQADTFIVVGDCTDICIQQFAVTLKTDFNRRNVYSRVVVPACLVETYDGGLHNGDLMNIISLYGMFLNGIELVTEII